MVKNLEDFLVSIAGPDWYTRSRDAGTENIIPDPSGQIFMALFNLEEIQAIQDAFANATGVASIITTTTGVPITRPSSFCNLCINVIRKTGKGLANCYQSDAVIGRYNPDGPVISTCLSGGLWDAGASITAGQFHVANWLIGQVRNEKTDINRMKEYAIDIGADVHEFLEAFDKVTVMPQSRFEDVSRALFLLANQMSQRAFQNLQQRKLIREISQARDILSRSPAVAFHWKNIPGWPVAFVTPNVINLLGYSAGEFMSGSILYESIIHPGDLSHVKNEVERYSNDRGIVEFTHDPYRVITKDGQIKWINDITRITRDDEGNITGYDGITIDMSERRKAEEETEMLKTRLQHSQKLEMLGTLAGGVAHDLNNILGSIIGYPDLILNEVPEGTKIYERVKKIQQSGERAAIIVQDLLMLARRGVMEMEVTNLNLLVESFFHSLEFSKILESGLEIKIQTSLDPDLLNISASVPHVTKIIMNLIINSVESMTDGGTITISTENRYIEKNMGESQGIIEGDYSVLKISDTGTGIASQDLGHIFEPFYTKKKMGKSGTGLGLAVVWGTIKDHHGHITVESTLGRGTLFTVFFPATREKMERRNDFADFSELSGKGEKILVIDDVQEQRDVASDILSRLGYSVITVSSGEEACEYLSTNRADLLILDMIMDPGIDGYETYRRILEIYPGQKAIIASGFSETDRVHETRKLGAGGYIKKPYTIHKIGRAVKTELTG